jgi:ADP-heptose:LPS heptosyltransferase
MRRSKYDLLLDYSCRRETSWVAQYWFGIRERIGFDFKNRGFFLTHRVPIPKGFSEKHVMEYYADLLSFIPVPVRSLKMDLFLRPEKEDEAAKMLKEGGFSEGVSYVCVSPGGGESWRQDAHFKRWRPERFAQLLNQLSSVTDFDGIVVVGTQGEKELGERLVSGVKKRALNLCGKVSLGASSAVLKRSLFHLTNDSGMAHIARALEVPCISIFGPVDQRIYGPYPPEKSYLAIGREDLACRPCYQSFRYNSDCAHRECLTELSPEEVFTKILQANFLSALPKGCEAPLR